MKLKVEHVFEAMVTLTRIIRENRQLPQKGSFYLARMHSKLYGDFQVISAQRDEIIASFGVHQQIPDPTWDRKKDPLGTAPLIDGPGFMIPEHLQAAFVAKWKPLADEEIEVDVQPIPLSALDFGPTVPGTISALELSILGELVKA